MMSIGIWGMDGRGICRDKDDHFGRRQILFIPSRNECAHLSLKIEFVPTVIDFVLSMLLGPRATQGINALKATFNFPALVHLVEVLSMIEFGIRSTLTDEEIQRGLEEFKSILDQIVDSRNDLLDWQKDLKKSGNAYLVNGCYGEILNLLGRNGYSMHFNHEG